MSADDHTLPDDNELQQDTPETSAPPPRIVSETPLGGVPKPETRRGTTEEIEEPRHIGVADNLVEHLQTVGPEDVSDSVNIPPKTDPPVEDIDPERETVPGDLNAAELAQQMRRAMTRDEDSQELKKVTLDAAVETPIVENSEDLPADPSAEWDDDISPELAAVLFAARPAPERAPTAAPAPPSSEPAPAAARPEPAPTPAPAAPAGSIQLTSRDDARRLAITAGSHAAPPPQTGLDARVRYVRIEEPLKGDEGQRIAESWEYFKGAYPALNGRLVREVSSEETRYADGSWKWTYERRYEDRGQDRREVRANASTTYIERDDTVSVIDAESRRSQHDEDVALIFAPPEAEEKRGGLLGGLFGRDKDDDAASGAPVWRPATSAEMKQARREGGDAFDRSLLERLF